MTRLLVAKEGIDINHRNNSELTAIAVAALSGEIDLVHLFVNLEGVELKYLEQLYDKFRPDIVELLRSHTPEE
jgi:hypothetical protein